VRNNSAGWKYIGVAIFKFAPRCYCFYETCMAYSMCSLCRPYKLRLNGGTPYEHGVDVDPSIARRGLSLTSHWVNVAAGYWRCLYR